MKTKIILLCLGMTLMLSACGNDTKVIEGEVKTASSESAETEEAKPGEIMEEEQAEETVQYKGYAFVYNDTVIEIDAEASPIIEKLGEPASYFEAASCAFEGIDRMYTYNSFEVDTYPMKDVDYISSVIFKDDSIMTTEGVGIGDSLDKVTEVYGNDGVNESGMLVFEKDNMKLCFIMQDDSVVSIEYRSTVLDE
ncbi:MAG: hypothetical protein HDR71_13165 [Lachnospiraceae bacterium]|nr:hypothetical protein [Lachnospiraceae bacterium]